MALSKIKKGDVFSLSLTNGFGLIQCVKEAARTEMETVRVLPGVFKFINNELVNDVILGKELFFISLPLKYAAKEGFISQIDNHPIPENSECPRYFRTKHVIKNEFVGWHIVDSETLYRDLVSTLSQEQKLLSPWGMISFPDIVERIENNWTPCEWYE